MRPADSESAGRFCPSGKGRTELFLPAARHHFSDCNVAFLLPSGKHSQSKEFLMNKPGIGLAPEGAPIIGLLTVISLCSAMLDWWPVTVPALILLWFSVHFFRDPERVIPQDERIAVSPADGRIVRMESRTDPMTGETRQCISIFMNIFSVHVNRVPVSGTVTGIRYLPGKFFNAAWDKASTDNEQCIWQMRDENGDEILADVELLRLAVPRRVFTLSQIKYVVDRVVWLYENREMIGGLRFVYEPPVLRFFMGGLEPTSDWPEKLMLKFRKDFGDSL